MCLCVLAVVFGRPTAAVYEGNCSGSCVDPSRKYFTKISTAKRRKAGGWHYTQSVEQHAPKDLNLREEWAGSRTVLHAAEVLP